MNEPDFEEQLRALRPAAPHRSLEERIEKELSRPAIEPSGRLRREPRSWLERLLPAIGWCATGAAAAIVTMLLLHLFDRHIVEITDQPNPVPTPPGAEGRPVATQGEVLAAAYEGIYESDEQGPTRVVRYESLERRQWTDDSGAITIVEVPRQDVLRVPVSFQ
jgi:hypothetical protein